MKGITPVIAVILLLLITIAMVGFAFVWFSRVGSVAMNATETQLRSQLDQGAKRVSIDNINVASGAVAVRNIGSASIPVGEISVYRAAVAQAACGWSGSIAPGATATCSTTGGACTSGTIIRITAPGNFDEVAC
jgi:flagellin-like protein